MCGVTNPLLNLIPRPRTSTLYLLTPCTSDGMYALTFSHACLVPSQESYDGRSVGSEKPQLCSASDSMLKVLSHLVKLQCSSNCASYSAVLRVDWDCWSVSY